tara:strand:- start:252 stop:623 length:372 start_codon:yes stop_codon:yes gene_type:complete
MSKEWTTEEKKKFAEVMGKDISTPDNENDTCWIETGINERTHTKMYSPFDNPLEHFNSIIKGLTPEQRKKITDEFQNVEELSDGYAELDDLMTYVWMHDNKELMNTAILKIVLQVLQESEVKK